MLFRDAVDSLENGDEQVGSVSRWDRSQGSQPRFLFAFYFLVCETVWSLTSMNPTMTHCTLSHREPKQNKNHPLKLLFVSLVTTRKVTNTQDKDKADIGTCWQRRSDLIS